MLGREGLGGVVAHLLLAVVHRGQLHDDGEVAPGADRDRHLRQGHAEDGGRLAGQAEAVVGLALLPALHLHDEVDLRLGLDGAHAVEVADVDDADAAHLHVIADHLRRGAHQGVAVDAPDLHGVVGDQPVAALDELQRGLALADAAVAHQEQALAVDLDQHAVQGHARGQRFLQRVDHVRLEFRGVHLGDEHAAVILARHLDALGEGGHAVADDERADVVLHETLEGAQPLLGGEGVEIGALDAAHDLDASGVEIVVEPGQLHGGTVDVGGRDQRRFIVFGERQRGEPVFLRHALELYRIFAAHTRLLSLAERGEKPSASILLSSSAFGNTFPHTRA